MKLYLQSGNVHFFDKQFNEIQSVKELQGEITDLRLSHSENYLAASDNKKFINVWNFDEEDKLKQYTDNFCFHSSKIYQMSFSQDDTMLVSSSLDRNCILWDLNTKKKVKIYEGVDHEVVITTAFVENSSFLAGGHNCTIQEIKIQGYLFLFKT